MSVVPVDGPLLLSGRTGRRFKGGATPPSPGRGNRLLRPALSFPSPMAHPDLDPSRFSNRPESLWHPFFNRPPPPLFSPLPPQRVPGVDIGGAIPR